MYSQTEKDTFAAQNLFKLHDSTGCVPGEHKSEESTIKPSRAQYLSPSVYAKMNQKEQRNQTLHTHTPNSDLKSDLCI